MDTLITPTNADIFGIGIPCSWNELEDGSLCVNKLTAPPTPLWQDGWYKNPSSGRSHNYGIDTSIPGKHQTVIVKGGSFFADAAFKNAFMTEQLSVSELYGGITIESAQREFSIASLIQHEYSAAFGKKANCPEPLGTKTVGYVDIGNSTPLPLVEYFLRTMTTEGSPSFTSSNFWHIAKKIGVDPLYPLNDKTRVWTSEECYRWLFTQCLKRAPQGIYWYRIDGPNTRLLDLMTQPLDKRRECFINTNGAADIRSAVESFATKLGEWYGFLHKNDIGYHSGVSEHCTLIDITVGGAIMDIGGLSQDKSCRKDAEEYFSELFKAFNLITYLCKRILCTDDDTARHGLRTLSDRYVSVYTDQTMVSALSNGELTSSPIRTKYFDNTGCGWIQLAPDLSED